MALIKPKEITVKDIDGVEKTVIISRLPATVGREVAAKYPVSLIPKIGDYATSEATMFLMMQYVGIPHPTDAGGVLTTLKTRELVNSHLNDWEALASVEKAMLSYNTNFFQPENLSASFAGWGVKLKLLVAPMLTDLLESLSKRTKPPSTN